MTFYHGLGMFIYNMGALLWAAIIAYIIIIIRQSKKNKKENLKEMETR